MQGTAMRCYCCTEIIMGMPGYRDISGLRRNVTVCNRQKKMGAAAPISA